MQLLGPWSSQKQADTDVTNGVVVPTKQQADAAPGAATLQSNSYVDFAREYPFANNVLIATCKTAAADILAQAVIAQTPLDQLDWLRFGLFAAFGAVYLGGFQYLYQVQVFKRIFDVDAFTSQPWSDKLRDGDGLRALAAQTALDLFVLSTVYLPTFYVVTATAFEPP